MDDDGVTLGREELLARVRSSILASVRGRVSPIDIQDITEEVLQLLRAALGDPELREALLEVPKLRGLLEEPAARQRLLVVLDQRTVGELWRGWFGRPATLLDLGAIGLFVIAALSGYALLSLRAGSVARTPGAARPIGAPLSPQHVAWLLQLPERQIVPAGIEIAARPDAVFAPGDPLHLRISLRAPALLVVLHQAAGGPGTQAWPGLGQAPALIPKPDAGGPAVLELALETRPGQRTHRLRLVVAPVDLDLGTLSPAALPGVAGRLTISDLRYEVTR